MAATQSEAHLVDHTFRQPVGDEAQEHRAPYHQDREVQKPLPQSHAVGPHKLHPDQQRKQWDKHRHDTKTAVHEVECEIGSPLAAEVSRLREIATLHAPLVGLSCEQVRHKAQQQEQADSQQAHADNEAGVVGTHTLLQCLCGMQLCQSFPPAHLGRCSAGITACRRAVLLFLLYCHI